jgi:hypothetical protein
LGVVAVEHVLLHQANLVDLEVVAVAKVALLEVLVSPAKVMMVLEQMEHLVVVVVVQLAVDLDCKAVLEHLLQLRVFQSHIVAVVVAVDMMEALVDLAVLAGVVLAETLNLLPEVVLAELFIPVAVVVAVQQYKALMVKVRGLVVMVDLVWLYCQFRLLAIQELQQDHR